MLTGGGKAFEAGVQTRHRCLHSWLYGLSTAQPHLGIPWLPKEDHCEKQHGRLERALNQESQVLSSSLSFSTSCVASASHQTSLSHSALNCKIKVRSIRLLHRVVFRNVATTRKRKVMLKRVIMRWGWSFPPPPASSCPPWSGVHTRIFAGR